MNEIDKLLAAIDIAEDGSEELTYEYAKVVREASLKSPESAAKSFDRILNIINDGEYKGNNTERMLDFIVMAWVLRQVDTLGGAVKLAKERFQMRRPNNMKETPNVTSTFVALNAWGRCATGQEKGLVDFRRDRYPTYSLSDIEESFKAELDGRAGDISDISLNSLSEAVYEDMGYPHAIALNMSIKNRLDLQYKSTGEKVTPKEWLEAIVHGFDKNPNPDESELSQL